MAVLAVGFSFLISIGSDEVMNVQSDNIGNIVAFVIISVPAYLACIVGSLIFTSGWHWLARILFVAVIAGQIVLMFQRVWS